MDLRLENQLVVAADLDATWQTLLDVPGVAGCLPGVTIDGTASEGAYQGSMRVKVGPVSLDYRGVARVAEINEAARTVVFSVEGKETRGQGLASATIRNLLVAENDATRVLLTTDLSVTGRAAIFAHEIIQDVAASMLNDFAASLSERIAEKGAATSRTDAQFGHGDEELPQLQHLNLGRHVGGTIARSFLRRTHVFSVVEWLTASLGRMRRRVTRAES
jgi:carbon monoxide dehydrogenase subunit G